MNEAQLGLFDPEDAAAKRAYLRARLEEAKTDSERDQIKSQLAALEEKPKPGAVWNGYIWASDEDVGF